MSRDIRVLVVDDVELARDRVRRALESHADVVVVGNAGDGEQMIALVHTLKPDLLIMDISMPEQDGFSALAALPAAERPLVIFVTAYSEHALSAFRADAVDYLMKPLDASALAIALNKVRARLSLTLQSYNAAVAIAPERISLRTTEAIILVELANILWVQAVRNYVAVHSNDGVAIVRSTLAEMLARLQLARFIRVNRSSVVNSHRIKRLVITSDGEQKLQLDQGTEITVGRAYRDGVMAAISC